MSAYPDDDERLELLAALRRKIREEYPNLSQKALTKAWAEGESLAEKAHSELVKTINRYTKNAPEHAALTALIAPRRATHLEYVNPFARWVWYASVLDQVMDVYDENSPWFAVTVISKKWATTERDWTLEPKKMRKWLQGHLAGVHFFGHIEDTVFVNRRAVERSVNRVVHNHFQLLAWGHDVEERLGEFAARLEEPMPGMKALVAKPVYELIGAVSYATKGSTFGRRSLRSESGKFKSTPSKLPLITQFRRLKAHEPLRFPDLMVAGGEGLKIRDALAERHPLPEIVERPRNSSFFGRPARPAIWARKS